jgi:tetratricopeptide (TPR) repeat protein
MQMINAKLKEAAAAHRTGRSQHAVMLAADALALARHSNDPLLVAYTLRHTADIHAQLGLYDQSATEIAEAIRIYREHASEHALDLANALRISALNAERRAHAAWHEAETLYASVDVQAGVNGAQHHIQHLSAALGGPS